jgi:hypothetical protein
MARDAQSEPVHSSKFLRMLRAIAGGNRACLRQPESLKRIHGEAAHCLVIMIQFGGRDCDNRGIAHFAQQFDELTRVYPSGERCSSATSRGTTSGPAGRSPQQASSYFIWSRSRIRAIHTSSSAR